MNSNFQPKYQSGIVKIAPNISQDSGSAVVFEDQVWYFCADSGNTVHQLTYDLKNVDSQTFDKGWQAEEFDPYDTGESLQAQARQSAVVVGESLHLFYSTPSKSKVSCLFRSNASWSPHFEIWTPKVPSGAGFFSPDPAKSLSHDPIENALLVQKYISAYSYGPFVILSWFTTMTVSGNEKLCLMNMLLDSRKRDLVNKRWTGERMFCFRIKDLLGQDEQDKDAITTTWITQGGDASFMAWAIYKSTSTDQSGWGTLISMDAQGMPDGRSICKLPEFENVSHGITLAATLNGELRAYYMDDTGYARSMTFLTARSFSGLGSIDADSGGQIQSGSTDDDGRVYIANAPVFVHVTSSQRSSQDPSGRACKATDLYSFVLYRIVKGGAKDFGALQVTRDGALESTAASVPMPSGKQQDKPLLIVTGMLDAPSPVPSQNLVLEAHHGHVSTLMFSKDPQSEVSVGTAFEQSSTYSVATEVTYGFETDGRFNKGIGPAWDASFERSTGRASGSLLESDQEQTTLLQTWLKQDEEDPDKVGVSDQCYLIGANIQSLVQQVYVFTNTNDTVEKTQIATSSGKITVPKHPSRACFHPGPLGAARSSQFTTFSVTPGDLYSYTEDAISHRIKVLYGQKVENAGLIDEFWRGIDPSLYAPYYLNPDDLAAVPYMDLIRAEAMPLGPSGSVALVFNTSDLGGVEPSVSQSLGAFREWSWKYDESLYAGISGGAGLELFGLEFEFSAMAGMAFSTVVGGSAEQKRTWSIGAKIGYPAAAFPGHVLGYTVYLYFVRSNVLWARELRYFSEAINTPIDPNSAPWRVMFTIDPRSIQFEPTKDAPLVGTIAGPLGQAGPTFPQWTIPFECPTNGGFHPARYPLSGHATLVVNGVVYQMNGYSADDGAVLRDLAMQLDESKSNSAQMTLDGDGITKLAITTSAV